MEIIQSRRQNILSRFFQMLLDFGWFILFSLIFLTFATERIDIWNSLTITLYLTVFTTLYLWFVYPEPSKKIVFTANGFEYHDYQLKRQVAWSDFDGYKISKFPNYQITLKIKNQDYIVFGYQVFSAKQRQQLFSALDFHHQN